MNKDDVRSKRTEEALLRALGELLQQKQLWEITVSELVQLAGVHRSTFYTHYTDIYALYKAAEDQFLGLCQELIQASEAHDYTGIFRDIITYLDENRSAAIIFFGDRCEPTFKTRLLGFAMEQYLEISAYEDQAAKIPQDWNLLAAYHIGGFMRLITDWVLSDFSISKESMISLCIELDLSMAKLRREKLNKA